MAVTAPDGKSYVKLFRRDRPPHSRSISLRGLWDILEVESGSSADFAYQIPDDTMRPYLPKGAYAYGENEPPADGDVGLFLLDGKLLCRQACQDYLGNIYLFTLDRSHSALDETVWHDSGRELLCIGRILLKTRPPLP